MNLTIRHMAVVKVTRTRKSTAATATMTQTNYQQTCENTKTVLLWKSTPGEKWGHRGGGRERNRNARAYNLTSSGDRPHKHQLTIL